MTDVAPRPEPVGLDGRRLRIVRSERTVDLAAAEVAVRDLLVALGHDPASEHLTDTPRRVARAYAELLTPRSFDLTTFPNEEGYDELVLARDIPFQSLCQHHLLPFHGVAHVGYIPAGRILGLSKLARVVELFGRGLQVQERLTAQIAAWLEERLEPKGVGVVLEAEHLCMSLRGVKATGSRTVTSALRGLVRDDPRTRTDFGPLPAPAAPGDPVVLSLKEFVGRAVYDRGRSLQGTPVRLVGFVTPDTRGGGFLLTRFIVTCCAADARPLRVAVRGLEPPGPAADTWLEVTGTWHAEPRAAEDQRPPVLDATDVRTIPAPTSPYLR